jgi:hypothetical protein
MEEVSNRRTFKTAWFAKAAQKAEIKDAELCKAIKQVMEGKCDDLGGGVYKKRLNKNMHRSLIVAKGGRYWVYAALFSKKDRANIEDDELDVLRGLADLYKDKTDDDIQKELNSKKLVEICNGEKIQK